jgi:hypothetical protein
MPIAQVAIPGEHDMASTRNSRLPSPSDRSARPTLVDEWGFYDPAQAGLAALFERLDEKSSVIDELDAAAIAVSIERASKLNES